MPWLICCDQGVRKHPDRPVRQQGGHEEQAGEGQDGDLPQEEEPAVLRDLCQEQLQLREAFSLPCKEALRVTTSFLLPLQLHCTAPPLYIYLGTVLDSDRAIINSMYGCDCRDMNLRFVEETALLPADVTVDLITQQQWVTLIH